MSQFRYTLINSELDSDTDDSDYEKEEDDEEVERQEIIDLISDSIQYSIEHEEEIDENVIELIRILSYHYHVELFNDIFFSLFCFSMLNFIIVDTLKKCSE